MRFSNEYHSRTNASIVTRNKESCYDCCELMKRSLEFLFFFKKKKKKPSMLMKIKLMNFSKTHQIGWLLKVGANAPRAADVKFARANDNRASEREKNTLECGFNALLPIASILTLYKIEKNKRSAKKKPPQKRRQFTIHLITTYNNNTKKKIKQNHISILIF